jgi:beta-lactamase superfamily II metal-dependent hydrolase
LPAADTLDFYIIDVEGGKAVLVVTPARQAMLIDAGWPGLQDEKFQTVKITDRDTDRIIECVRSAGVKQIDYFVVTHYDQDHGGNVARTAAKMRVPIRAFVDHGEVMSQGREAQDVYASYTTALGSATRVIVKAGDRIPLKGVEVDVVTSAGEVLKTPLPGGGIPNPYCPGEAPSPSRGENPASVGLVFTFGKFRTVDLSDLPKARERELMCPNNPIGTVGLLLVSHHAFDMSNLPLLVHALKPVAAIVNNGERHGGQAGALQTVRDSPGLEDMWQMHLTPSAGKERNAPEKFIANLSEADCRAYWIKVAARRDGSFRVTNTRNGFSKTYP